MRLLILTSSLLALSCQPAYRQPVNISWPALEHADPRYGDNYVRPLPPTGRYYISDSYNRTTTTPTSTSSTTEEASDQ